MKSPLDKSSYTGIILAGGKSERMGKDKGLMDWKGKQLVQYSIEALRPFCDHMIISTNNDEYARFGIPLVKDEYPNIGPMGGLHAGLKASKTEHNLFMSCDMPLVDEEVISLLLESVKNHQAVVPVVDGRLIPVCAY
jgi:molybdenum cofactor guanylyltransferase